MVAGPHRGLRTGVPSEVEMPFLEHLKELRRRLIASSLAVLCGAVFSFVAYDAILRILFKPFEAVPHSTESLLFANTIFEGFLIKIKVAILSGIILSLPVHLYNIVRFVFPGLTRREREVIGVSLLSSFVLIALSAYYGYFKVVPVSVQFLTSSGFIPERIGLLLNFGKSIFFILQFLLITVVVFQLPIALEILLIMNVVKRRTLLRASRYVIVAIFVLAAILTPGPDFISQLGLAVPLVTLYFLTLLVARVFGFGGD